MALSHYLPVFIQVGLRDEEKLLFRLYTGDLTSLSDSASLKMTSAVEISAVFEAPNFSNLG